uniref:Centrosomal protein 290 n=2 Tax=Sus scrofa TaxID=9823 RepID=A0A8D1FPV0_PIG
METLNFHNLKLSLPLVKYFIRFTLLSFLFFLSEKETWKTESETMKEEKRKLEDQIQQDAIKVKEYNEMAVFKIAALQKVIDNSVSLSELELANKQYNELTIKYRDILQKDNMLVQRTNNLEHLECENASLKEQMESVNKELEITKEKLHTLEQAWEQEAKFGNESNMDKARKSVTNSEIVSISKKITTLEMKELNERQRAEHAQKMYEHAKTSLKQMEERNIELETKFAEV